MAAHTTSWASSIGALTIACQVVTAVDYSEVEEPPCAAGRTSCDGSCWDLSTSREHCGACNRSCGWLECIGGECGCAPPAERCDNDCVLLSHDPKNCGACGHDCGDYFCEDGECTSHGPCGELTYCQGSCVDVSNDPHHCGSCFHVCPTTPCVAGVCQSADASSDADAADAGADA